MVPLSRIYALPGGVPDSIGGPEQADDSLLPCDLAVAALVKARADLQMAQGKVCPRSYETRLHAHGAPSFFAASALSAGHDWTPDSCFFGVRVGGRIGASRLLFVAGEDARRSIPAAVPGRMSFRPMIRWFSLRRVWRGCARPPANFQEPSGLADICRPIARCSIQKCRPTGCFGEAKVQSGQYGGQTVARGDVVTRRNDVNGTRSRERGG